MVRPTLTLFLAALAISESIGAPIPNSDSSLTPRSSDTTTTRELLLLNPREPFLLGVLAAAKVISKVASGLSLFHGNKRDAIVARSSPLLKRTLEIRVPVAGRRHHRKHRGKGTGHRRKHKRKRTKRRTEGIATAARSYGDLEHLARSYRDAVMWSSPLPKRTLEIRELTRRKHHHRHKPKRRRRRVEGTAAAARSYDGEMGAEVEGRADPAHLTHQGL